jgi:uncharacterized protein
MPLIRETVVTTCDARGRVHLAPLGLIAEGDSWIIAPFRPSTTLENLRAVPYAVANATDDVRVFAGCLTGRRDWPTVPADVVPVPRLAVALAHTELAVSAVTEDDERPRFHCRVVATGLHAAFTGFNRAQAAVVEAAILVSRLHLLSREHVEGELARLAIAVDKTAGEGEREAWRWLMERVHGEAAGSSTARC